MALVLGLAGSQYMYYDTKADLNSALQENMENQNELTQLSEGYNDLFDQLQELADSNTELESRIAELETEAEDDVPPVVVETQDIVLEITGEGEVRNVILLIGDGMGVGQLTAAEIENGDDSLVLMSLPHMSMVSTHSESYYVTDSAASATALATGYKTKNGIISMSPEGEILFTVVEFAEESGMSTGVVSTTRVTHATPACFMAHVQSRNFESQIASQILDSGVDVVLGGGSLYFDSLDPSGAGYVVVESREELMGVESGMVLGLFSTEHMSFESERDPEVEPSVAEMTMKSIELLSGDPDGFVLIVEGGRIDHASHDNDFENTLNEVYAFDLAVLEALEFASGRNDTLVIVTADHETGGLLVTGGYPSGQAQYDWISDDHTGNLVPVFAYGPLAENVLGFSDNTDIGDFLISVIG